MNVIIPAALWPILHAEDHALSAGVSDRTSTLHDSSTAGFDTVVTSSTATSLYLPKNFIERRTHQTSAAFSVLNAHRQIQLRIAQKHTRMGYSACHLFPLGKNPSNLTQRPHSSVFHAPLSLRGFA